MQKNLNMSKESEVDLNQIMDIAFSSVNQEEFNGVEEVGETISEIDEDEKQELINAVEDNEEETEEVEIVKDVEEDSNVEEISEDEEPTESESYKVVQFLLDSGELEDFELEIDDSENPIKLSEFKNIDAETLKEVIKQNREESDKKLKDSNINVKGLDETQKSLINIIKNSNFEDVKKIFKDEIPLQEPWSDYNQNDEKHQAIAYRYYLMNALGHSQDEAEVLVETARKNLTLDVKANAVVTKQKELYKETVKKKEQEIADKKEQEKKDKLEYKKALTEKYKDLEPQKASELVKSATIENDGGATVVEQRFREVLSNPDEAHELIMYLLDKDLFNKVTTSKARTDEQINNIRRIKISNSTRKSGNQTDASTDTETSTNVEDTLGSIFGTK